MPYTLPVFNITVKAWHYPNTPNQVHDLSYSAQFYIRTQQNNDNEYVGRLEQAVPVWLRCPLGTDVRMLDIIEIPENTGRYYFCANVDIAHLGFANAYTLALVSQALGFQWGNLILENGDRLVQEDGYAIVLQPDV